MLFGICISMAATDSQGAGVSRIAEAAGLGFDYVELPLAQVMQLTQTAFKAGPMRAAGIPCLCLNNFFPASIRLTGPAANHAQALEYAARAFDRAAELGADRVVFGSGGARNVPDGFPVKRARDQLALLLTSLAPLARQRGITVVIEPLNRAESNIINSLEEGIALARCVDDSSIACLVDFYHAGLVGDPCASVGEAGPLLRHVHMARTPDRFMPANADEAAYRPFFAALRTAGYDATISLEALAPAGFSGHAKAALTLLRTLWDETAG
ncbi:MAG: sugar phosphate isomerase/epimerase [Clostridia bacterium]|nr:sugar phosphate isomerase/epimerase [Clostridia bacterium]